MDIAICPEEKIIPVIKQSFPIKPNPSGGRGWKVVGFSRRWLSYRRINPLVYQAFCTV
jgi:hypothetical protein